MAFLCLFVSCLDNHKSALLEQAQNTVENEPLQALALLDSIYEPEEMSENDYMKYIVARVQAKYKTYKDITTDSSIFVARKYFEQKNEYRYAALANFYAGGVYLERKMPDKAFENFLRANYYANKTKDYILSGKALENIGHIYFQKGQMDSASLRYKEALSFYDKVEGVNLKMRLPAINMIGASYESIPDFDSAYVYFNKGLKLSQEADYPLFVTQFTHNLGILYCDMKDYPKAVDYLQKALEQGTNTTDSLKIYIHLAKAYSLSNKLDSAAYYVSVITQRLPNITNPAILEVIYNSLHEYYYQKGNLDEALRYSNLWKEANQKILENRSTEKLLNAENKFQMQIRQQEHEAERDFFILLYITFIILLLLAFMFCRKRKYKKLKILEEKVHSLTQDRLFENSIASKSYLENVYEHFIIGWSEIEIKVNHILLTGREELDIEIYIEIKAMVDALKKQTNQQLLLVAKDYLSSDLFLGKKLSTTLSDRELVILMLCHLEYSEEAIAFIIDSKAQKFELSDIKWNIERKLYQAGMNDFNIKALLYPES